ncbi:hypothetical protein SNE40_022680 [Patella caerulea]|uniref:snRNA-activating protein complex subunit 5 n=1 Tax=Patella caerulea TaxID=87958 RepID=A0AAN8G195_PATCE
MASFAEIKRLQEEEKALISLTSRFSDQLTRLKVEELALVSMLRREAEEKDSEGSSENETQHVEVVKNKQEDLDLAVQDPFSLAFQDEEEDEEEDEPEHEMDDLNSFLNELTAKHTKS